MSDLKPSWWDSDDAATALWAVDDPRQKLSPEERMALRIRAFDQAVGNATEFTVAAIECDKRVDHLRKQADGNRGEARRISRAVPIVVIAIGVASGWPLLMLSANPVVLFVSLSVALFGAVMLYARRTWWLSALKRRLCPTCGFNLVDSPPRYDATSFDSLRVGPRVCSECGSAWPFVPPALELGDE